MSQLSIPTESQADIDTLSSPLLGEMPVNGFDDTVDKSASNDQSYAAHGIQNDDGTTDITYNVPPPTKNTTPYKTPHKFSFDGASASEGGLANKQMPIDPNKMVTELILKRAKQMEDRENQYQDYEPPKEVEIHEIASTEILNISTTPFTHEDTLPNFEDGSVTYYYFKTLRTIIDKWVRAQKSDEHIKECLERKIIPRGFKLNKKILAVDPSPKLKLEYYKISARAETEMMIACRHHYKDAIPKLSDDFNEYYDETKALDPTDRRLMILKLIHYKNQVIAIKDRNLRQKAEEMYSNDQHQNQPQPWRFDNRNNTQPPSNDYDGYQGGPSRNQNRQQEPRPSRSRNRVQGGPPSRDFRGSNAPQKQYRQDNRRQSPRYGRNRPRFDQDTVQDDWNQPNNNAWYPNDSRGGQFPPPKNQRQQRSRPQRQGRNF
jgi:hypothetical protein